MRFLIFFFDQYNHSSMRHAESYHRAGVKTLNNKSVEVPTIVISGFEFKFENVGASNCKFEIDSPSLNLPKTLLQLNFSVPAPIDLQAGGTFDFDGILRGIDAAYKDAKNAFKESNGASCCPAARVAKGIPAEGEHLWKECGWSQECESRRCNATGNGKKCPPKVE